MEKIKELKKEIIALKGKIIELQAVEMKEELEYIAKQFEELEIKIRENENNKEKVVRYTDIINAMYVENQLIREQLKLKRTHHPLHHFYGREENLP